MRDLQINEIVAAYLSADDDASAEPWRYELLLRATPVIKQVLRRQTDRTDFADDLLGEACLDLADRLLGLRERHEPIENFYGLVWEISKRRVRKARKRAKQESTRSCQLTDDIPDGRLSTERQVESAASIRELYPYIAGLSLTQRRILILKWKAEGIDTICTSVTSYEDLAADLEIEVSTLHDAPLTDTEIGAITGQTAAQVATTRNTTRETLDRRLERDGHDIMPDAVARKR